MVSLNIVDPLYPNADLEVDFDDVRLDAVPLASTLSTFRGYHSLAGDGSDDLLDPAEDGIGNLLKFAFNMIGSGTAQAPDLASPNVEVIDPSGSAGLPMASVDVGGALNVTYLRRTAASAPGITYSVEFSNNLTSWQPNPAATENVTAIDALFERVTVTDSVPAAAGRFARVRVESL